MSLKLIIKTKILRDFYRRINGFKKGHQLRINIIKDETDNLIGDRQVLNVHGIDNVREKDIQRAEPLVPESSLVEVEIAIGKLKSCKSLGIDQIPAELIKAGGEIICFEINSLICSIWNKEELPQQWKEYIILPNYKKGEKTDCNSYGGISLLSTAYKILSNIFRARSTTYVNEVTEDHLCGLHSNNRSITHQIFNIRQMLQNKCESIMGRCISYL
jgi:hypothetical protein